MTLLLYLHPQSVVCVISINSVNHKLPDVQKQKQNSMTYTNENENVYENINKKLGRLRETVRLINLI